MKKGTFFTSFGAIIILVISFIAFILPSSFGSATKEKPQSFGSYNGREIIYKEGDSDFYFNLLKTQNINSAVEETITQYAFEDMLKSSGYVTPTQTINKQIRKEYIDADGNFSKNKLRLASNQEITNLTKQIKSQLISNTMSFDLYKYQISRSDRNASMFTNKISDNELSYYNELSADTRAFNMVAFEKDNFPKEEIINWAEQNKAKFDSFDFSIATFSDEKTATKYADQLEKNQITFEDLLLNADNKKLMTNSENKCIYTQRYEIENLLENKADISILDSLEVGKTSRPISFNNSYAIIRMNNPLTQIDLKDMNNIEKIKTFIFNNEQSLVEDYFIALGNKFKEYAVSNSFDKACSKFNVTKTEIAPFALNYASSPLFSSIDSSIPSLSQASINENFLTTAFKLNKNEISDPIVTSNNSNNGYVVVLQYVDTKKSEEDYNLAKELQYSILQNNDKRSVILSVMNDPKTKIENLYY